MLSVAAVVTVFYLKIDYNLKIKTKNWLIVKLFVSLSSEINMSSLRQKETRKIALTTKNLQHFCCLYAKVSNANCDDCEDSLTGSSRYYILNVIANNIGYLKLYMT